MSSPAGQPGRVTTDGCVRCADRPVAPVHREPAHRPHPGRARHGKPWHQFAFWFCGNINAFNVVLGAVLVSTGLTFWQALIAIAVGALIGALLIALHATQWSRLGVPQTIQSRGQFGFYGAAFLFPMVLLLNVGLTQGLQYGLLPARETTWAWPPSGLLLAGVALLVIIAGARMLS